MNGQAGDGFAVAIKAASKVLAGTTDGHPAVFIPLTGKVQVVHQFVVYIRPTVLCIGCGSVHQLRQLGKLVFGFDFVGGILRTQPRKGGAVVVDMAGHLHRLPEQAGELAVFGCPAVCAGEQAAQCTVPYDIVGRFGGTVFVV